MGELRVMEMSGDIKTIWDKDKEDEVEAARKQFNEMKKKGYIPFSVDKSGEKGKKIEEFDFARASSSLERAVARVQVAERR